MRSETRKSAIRKVMQMGKYSRAAAEAYVDGKLRELEAQIKQGIAPVELGKTRQAELIHADPRFLVN